jgi:hypothetical protein
VVQEAFVKAFLNLPKFRAGEPFAPWLPAGASLPSAPRPTASVSSASVPAAPALAAAPKPSGTTAPAWLIATIASAAAIVIAVTAL